MNSSLAYALAVYVPTITIRGTSEIVVLVVVVNQIIPNLGVSRDNYVNHRIFLDCQQFFYDQHD